LISSSLKKQITVFYIELQKEELAKAASLKEQQESTVTVTPSQSTITVVPEHQDTVIEVTSNVTKVSYLHIF